ncbi:MAG: stage 0 sporulation protein, partial [Desulfobacterales bacterium]|nr:stage 0 sporulation protein [Desulfobacterales bacterium]
MKVVGVELDNKGRVQYFDEADLKLEKADLVVVDAEKGVAMGTVVIPPQEEKSGLFKRSLRKVIRKATAKDV